jgi:N6-adenosine-specific RNA methylase IME4
MMKIHPAADVFPLLGDTEFDALVADIKTHGLITAITVFRDKILDGRNRYRACLEANVEPRFVEFEGDDPIAFVVSANIKRRHLDESQRAMIAARLANMSEGRPWPSKDNSANLPSCVSQRRAGELVNVSTRSVTNASVVLDRGAPELVRAVDLGQIAVSVAAELARQKLEAQLEAARNPERASIIAKQKLRAEKEAALAQRQLALPAKKFNVIYADPAWRFEVWSRDSGLDRAADNHFPTTELAEIKALDVASIAADDAVLFLWATAPMLPHALKVMNAWGFAYKSHFVWVKDRSGTGYWNRCQHELLLVGTRGKPPAPAQGEQWGSAIRASVGEHSEKPEDFYRLIESYFPNLPKIELFARTRRHGWDAWGHEAPGRDCCEEEFAVAEVSNQENAGG